MTETRYSLGLAYSAPVRPRLSYLGTRNHRGRPRDDRHSVVMVELITSQKDSGIRLRMTM